MTQIEQTQHAKEFAEYWQDKGDEKQEAQRYWIGLLQEVLGVENPSRYIEFEKTVKIKHTNFIDGYISSTKVLIEQKGAKVDLTKPQEQSDGAMLTPYQQAKRYADELSYDLKPRWIVVSNFKEIHVHDMNNLHAEPEIILLENLEKEYYRLQFLVDTKNENIRREEEISLQAGILVGKLYDALIKEYINPDESSLRSLNILCVRLVFCFYAEDAGLFETRTSFEDYIKSFNLPNLRKAMIDLFKGLDTKLENRDKYDTSLKPFPYVNGGLFAAEDIEIPNFTQEIVDVLVNDCAPFDWREISPTIFGAVFESTLNPETRRTGGMHYTSIENIHKVIDPLFMDELNAEFEAIASTGSATSSKARSLSGVEGKKLSPKQRIEALHAFQEKLGNLKFLDPACGSGNFLTETYLSIRRLENKVISILNNGEKVLGFDEFIKVKINQFYGIEINDFAVTVAKTALWIAESQMMTETEKIIGMNLDFLPLHSNAYIHEGNALRMDWETFEVLPENKNVIYADKTNIYKIDSDDTTVISEPTVKYGEVNIVTKEVEFKNVEELQTQKTISVTYDYIMGNPPFVGFTYMTNRQKEDMEMIFPRIKNLDYVCCWYKKASEIIQGKNTRCGFVSTNSITQGETVARFAPMLNVHYDFAYRTFKWENETLDKKNMAAVHCVIIGFSAVNYNKEKFIVNESGEKIIVKNINSYLVDAQNIIVESRNKPLCKVPQMIYGNKPADGGFLIIEEDAYEAFIQKDPNSKKFIRPLLGAVEFLHNKKRWCLWLVDASPAEIKKCPLIYERVKKCKENRESSVAAGIRKFADTPHLFAQRTQPESVDYIIIPRVSSENRKYVPMSFMTSETIVSDAVQIVPNANLYDFGILTSSVHMAWMRSVCGRLESRYRYSKDVVYNNFPWVLPETEMSLDVSNPCGNPFLCTSEQAKKIEQTAQAILDARAKYPDSSLADLYDDVLMPIELRKAHQANDRAVMEAYGFAKDITETEIVAELFKMYEKLTEGK